MRILLLSHEYPPMAGGMGTQSYEMARWAKLANIEVTVIAPDFGQDNRTFDANQDFETLRFQGMGVRKELPRAVRQLYTFWKQNHSKFEFLYCPNTIAQVTAALVSRALPMPYCLTAYGSEILLYKASILRRMLSAGLYKRAFAISCYSHYTFRLLQENFTGISAEKVFVQLPGVDASRFSCASVDSRVAREKLNLPTDAFVLLTIARLDPRKGHDVVISALKELGKKGLKGVYYIIVGAGSYEATIRKMISASDLDGHVWLAGGLDYSSPELISYYDACDVFVLPSRQEGRTVEGYGIVFNEAAARGKPSIGGAHGGVPEAIQHNKTGLLVNPLDHRELAEAIRRLRHDEDWRIWLGKNARDRVLGELRWEQVVERTYRGITTRWRALNR